jgi:GT2 family glycosyltransferase
MNFQVDEQFSVLIISVNYGNPSPVEDLIKSIQPNSNITLWIEDNSSSNLSLMPLMKMKEGSGIAIDIFPHTQNHFYWGAAIKGLNRLNEKKLNWPRWIIVCNNDICFDNQFFTYLKTVNVHKNKIIAPKIFSNFKKTNLNPFFNNRLSKIEKMYYKLVNFHWLTAKMFEVLGKYFNRYINHKTNKNSAVRPIYAPHGSCIIFSSEYFQMGGYLDDGFQMFGEELSTAEIARKLNVPIMYHPQLIMTHNDHFSTGNLSWRELYNISQSTYYYLNKTYNL